MRVLFMKAPAPKVGRERMFNLFPPSLLGLLIGEKDLGFLT
jgi:hypothetical protein